MNLSVIICTHNPRDEYLQRTLQALRGQTLDVSKWELLLIDNLSERPVEGRFDVSWHPRGRIIREEQLGLTNARLRGFRESTGEILCYVDDDNILNSDYLEQALRIGSTMPLIGCWGGEILPEYETPPPTWFKGCEVMLAIRPLERDLWGNAYSYDDASPCGAGLCAQRAVVTEYLRNCELSPLRRSLDRCGTSMASCGDLDLAFTAVDMGLGIGRFKALSLLHLIPSERLDPRYLIRLAEGSSETVAYLNFLRCADPSKPIAVPGPIARVKFWLRWLITPFRRKQILMAQWRGKRRACDKLAAIRNHDRSGSGF